MRALLHSSHPSWSPDVGLNLLCCAPAQSIFNVGLNITMNMILIRVLSMFDKSYVTTLIWEALYTFFKHWSSTLSQDRRKWTQPRWLESEHCVSVTPLCSSVLVWWILKEPLYVLPKCKNWILALWGLWVLHQCVLVGSFGCNPEAFDLLVCK